MKILKLTETASTNDVLLAHPAPPNGEIVVAVAEYQTAGRGQSGGASLHTDELAHNRRKTYRI